MGSGAMLASCTSAIQKLESTLRFHCLELESELARALSHS